MASNITLPARELGAAIGAARFAVGEMTPAYSFVRVERVADVAHVVATDAYVLAHYTFKSAGDDFSISIPASDARRIGMWCRRADGRLASAKLESVQNGESACIVSDAERTLSLSFTAGPSEYVAWRNVTEGDASMPVTSVPCIGLDSLSLEQTLKMFASLWPSNAKARNVAPFGRSSRTRLKFEFRGELRPVRVSCVVFPAFKAFIIPWRAAS